MICFSLEGGCVTMLPVVPAQVWTWEARDPWVWFTQKKFRCYMDGIVFAAMYSHVWKLKCEWRFSALLTCWCNFSMRETKLYKHSTFVVRCTYFASNEMGLFHHSILKNGCLDQLNQQCYPAIAPVITKKTWWDGSSCIRGKPDHWP